MDEENDRKEAAVPIARALALLAGHRYTQARLGSLRSRWETHVAALMGDEAGQPLAPDEALALIAEQRISRKLLAQQRAQWERSMTDDLMADERIARYHPAIGRHRRKPAKPATPRARSEKEAWKLLKQKLSNPTRSEPMSTEQTTTAAPAAVTAPPLDWAEPHGEAASLTFATAKGSTYTVNPDGTTTRDKAARPEHPGDFGPQQPSQTTFYVDHAGLNALAEFQAKGNAHKRIAQYSSGMWGIQYTDGPQAGKFERRTVIAGKTEPQVGLIPVELWNDGAVAHFGNSIIKVDHPAVVAPDSRPDFIPAMAEKAKFAQAKQDALADPARASQTNADRFALDQAQRDRMAPAPWAGALDGFSGARTALGRLTPQAQPENTIEPVLVVETGAVPVRLADATARTQALDAAALEQLAAVRETERQEVARLRGWSENAIERADVAVNAPAAPAAPSLAKPALVVDIVPPEVESAFLRVGNKFHMLKNQQRVAFEDHGIKLKTALNDSSVALAMVQIAQARGWTAIKVSGTPEFCRDAWQKAALRGMVVQGYEPNELDKADLARRLAARPAPNQLGQGAAAASAAAPVQVNGQPGIFISADDAALLAAAKAALQQPAASLAPARTAAPAAADILVSHGPAHYQHDPESALSYVVRLRNAAGKEREVWGVNLGRAIAESGVQVGERITLTKNGEEQVEVDAKVKNEAGRVVGTQRIGAVRNEWKVKAHAFATLPPAQAAQAHPELAGALAITEAIGKRAAADGFTPAQLAIIAARTQQNLTNSIERGSAPGALIRDKAAVKRQPQQEMTQ